MTAACPLSIVIVSWNTRDLLAACLESLARPGGMPTGSEIIVVDNASEDDSVAYLRAHFPDVCLIENRVNGGFATATNQGLASARGEHLLLLNSDTEVRPGALEAMVTHLRRHERAGAVGADVRNPDGSAQPCGGQAPSLLSETASILGFDRKLRALASIRQSDPAARAFLQRDWVMGAALMVRRAVYESVGPLDTGYFFYSEEVDWCTRIRKAGWQVGTLVGARVLHHGGGSTWRTGDRMRPALFRSKVRYLSIHEGKWAALAFRSVVHVVASLHIIGARLIGGQEHEEEASWLAVRQSV